MKDAMKAKRIAPHFVVVKPRCSLCCSGEDTSVVEDPEELEGCDHL